MGACVDQRSELNINTRNVSDLTLIMTQIRVTYYGLYYLHMLTTLFHPVTSLLFPHDLVVSAAYGLGCIHYNMSHVGYAFGVCNSINMI